MWNAGVSVGFNRLYIRKIPPPEFFGEIILFFLWLSKTFLLYLHIKGL